jgi:hypothetical protein
MKFSICSLAVAHADEQTNLSLAEVLAQDKQIARPQ